MLNVQEKGKTEKKALNLAKGVLQHNRQFNNEMLILFRKHRLRITTVVREIAKMKRILHCSYSNLHRCGVHRRCEVRYKGFLLLTTKLVSRRTMSRLPHHRRHRLRGPDESLDPPTPARRQELERSYSTFTKAWSKRTAPVTSTPLSLRTTRCPDDKLPTFHPAGQ